ncbi:MAG: hypothetical protein L0H84_12630 [Pseudonocardia sp.]|nr:hypothetical protein [Pseudonocardia sp.]
MAVAADTDDESARALVPGAVLELSSTSWRLRPYTNEMGDNGPPFAWDPECRALLRADLDAAFLHVCGRARPEAEHVLDSFFVAATSSTPPTAWPPPFTMWVRGPHWHWPAARMLWTSSRVRNRI